MLAWRILDACFSYMIALEEISVGCTQEQQLQVRSLTQVSLLHCDMLIINLFNAFSDKFSSYVNCFLKLDDPASSLATSSLTIFSAVATSS
jgi:hypothetical protein